MGRATRGGHTALAAWLTTSEQWITPLHHLSTMDAARARAHIEHAPALDKVSGVRLEIVHEVLAADASPCIPQRQICCGVLLIVGRDVEILPPEITDRGLRRGNCRNVGAGRQRHRRMWLLFACGSRTTHMRRLWLLSPVALCDVGAAREQATQMRRLWFQRCGKHKLFKASDLSKDTYK